MISTKIIDKLRVAPGKRVRLKHYNPGWAQSKELRSFTKDEVKAKAQEILRANLAELTAAQQLLYADDRYSVLVILQGLDAAGKDGTIRHVMSGLNPQGCEVTSFKQPTSEELDHTFLWRCMRKVPERGRIGIFNRSHYEDVLVVRVHPDLLDKARLPTTKRGKSFWRARYDDINAFEHHLVRNGTIVLKFFLHLSADEQKRRLLERLENPEKHWKFSAADLKERALWDRYQTAYEEALSATSTPWAPWYVVPADHKWIARTVIADVLTTTVLGLDLRYPQVSDEQRKELALAREKLLAE